MKPYSNDLRQKVVEAYKKGEGSMRKLARRFSVSLSFVWLLMQRYRETGGVAPKAHGGGQARKLTLYDEVVLEQLVKDHPAATLMELSELLKDKTEAEVSASTIGLTLRRRGITRKKISYPATEREESEEVQQAREEFQEEQPKMEAKKLIFVDEAGTNLGMAQRDGRALSGCRAQADKPYNPGQNISLVGALGLDGVAAMMMLEGSVNGNAFSGFTEQLLVPELKPGDQVWMDNL